MTRSRTLRLPEQLADALDKRAKANHRSAQAEIIAILSAAMEPRRHVATPVDSLGTNERPTCPYCNAAEGSFHHPDCYLMRKGKSHMSAVLDDLSSTPQTPCAD